MRSTVTAVMVLLLAGIGVQGVGPVARGDDGTTVLQSFESDDIAQHVHNVSPQYDGVARLDDIGSDGTHALLLREHAKDSLATLQATPEISLQAGEALRAVSWRDHLIFTMDFANLAAATTTVWIGIADEQGHSYTAKFGVPGYGYHSGDIAISNVAAAGVDLDQVSQVRVTGYRAPWEIPLVIDNVRFTETWPYDHGPIERALTPGTIAHLGLVDRIDTAEQSLVAIEQRIPVGAVASDWLHSQAAGFDAALDALRTRATDSGLTLSDAADVAAQIDTVSWRVKRLGSQTAAAQVRPVAPYGLASSDSMALAYPRELPCRCDYARTTTLALARGEYESTQAVVFAYGGNLDNVRVDGGVTSAPDDATSDLDVSVHPLGFVDVPRSAAFHTKPSAYRPGDFTGWMPDPIRADLGDIDVAAGDLQPFWVQVKAAPEAVAGDYTVKVTVATGGVTQSLEIRVTVWPIGLPDRPALATAMTYNPLSVAKVYGITDADQISAIDHRYTDFFETYKIEPDTIYRGAPPTVEQLQWIQQRWGLRHFCLLYVDPRAFDINKPDSWPARIDSIMATIGTALESYRAAGLADKAYVYGFDESTAAYFPLIKQILERLDSEFPDLTVMTTMRDGSFGTQTGLQRLIDIWAPEIFLYDPSTAAEARARGDLVYWYPAIADSAPLPNWFNGYPPSDTRILTGAMSYQQDVDGLLYYNMTRWPTQGPMNDGIYSSWDPRTFSDASGDGSLLYPGPDPLSPLASQRLQNFRDGMEDYNLLAALRVAIDRATDADPTDILRAKVLLSARAVVTSKADYIENPAAYRAWRSDVAQAITKLR